MMNTVNCFKKIIFIIFLISLMNCAGKPTIYLNRTPDALYDTLRESASIHEEENHIAKEESCYKMFFNNQVKYDDCLSRPKKRIRPDRYKQHDPLFTLPDWKQQNGKILNIR